MAKFKVGDKVRVVRNNGDDFNGVKIGDVGEVVEICRGKYPVYLKINNHAQYAFKEQELELYKEDKMEKTFREVIADIKEGEVWVNEIAPISFIRLREDGVLDFNENEGINLNVMYRLQRKEYTFEEAFKAYEEGKEIESCEECRFKLIDKDTTLIIDCAGDEMEYSNKTELFSVKEIRGKWYIND